MLTVDQWLLVIISVLVGLFFYWVGTHSQGRKEDDDDLDDWDQMDQLENDEVEYY